MRKSEVRRRKAEQAKIHPSGFTLLELIIAITILPLIILIIGNGFRLGMNAWEKGEQETVWTQRFRVLSGLLSQQIKSAYPYIIDVDNEKLAVFEGKPGSVMFVTVLADSAYGGFKWVRYSQKDGALLIKEGLLPDKKLKDNITGDEEVVDSGIGEIQFSYLSLEENEWKDSWDLGKKIPGAVRVKIPNFEPFLITIPMGLAQNEQDKESGPL